MIRILLIAISQVKAGNTSENYLNEVLQIINSFYQKEITKKVYSNITNSIKVSYKVNTVFIYCTIK